MTIKCTDCKKVLKPEEKGKTWQELFKGYPACKKCDEDTAERIDKNMKVITSQGGF